MIVTQDFTTGPPEPPLEGWVERCPRCGRSGVREEHEGAEIVVHAEQSELLSDGMLVEPSDCCYL